MRILMKAYRNILVIKMSALGDIIHALPSLYALRRLYPGAGITWLVEPQFAAILPGMPYIDEKFIFHKNTLKKLPFLGKIAFLRQLRADLHRRRFDLVIDLQGLFKSSLVAVLSGCPERIGYCEMREGSFLVTRPIYGKNSKGHIIQRYLDVIRSLGEIPAEVVFPLPDFSREAAKMRGLLAQAGAVGKLAVFFPAAGWASKEWPPGHYAHLAVKFAEKGVSVALAGGAADAGKAEMIKKMAAPLDIIDFTGQTNIIELLGLVKQASICVGGDTGPLHLAAAAGVPTVSLFGPSSGQRAGTYGPLSEYISTGAPCAPCFKRNCPRREFVCMPRISAGEVFAVCEKSMI
ncbi:MAG: glycosyltransferase family 9 protein [Acidaminococcales bacterium]|nr:glycosyltransferase family 9 protein [Acidaminococcales bacterium]